MKHSNKFLIIIKAIGCLGLLNGINPNTVDINWSDKLGFNQTDRDFIKKYIDAADAMVKINKLADNL